MPRQRCFRPSASIRSRRSLRDYSAHENVCVVPSPPVISSPLLFPSGRREDIVMGIISGPSVMKPGNLSLTGSRTMCAATRPVRLRYDALHDIPMDIRQPEIAPRITERQPQVIEPEQMQHGRVQVVEVHARLDRVVAVVIG